MSPRVWDVVVVGGGTVGASVARALAKKGKSVVILEAGTGDSLDLDNYRQYVEAFQAGSPKATSTGYPDNPDAPSPNVLQVGSSDGYFVQRPREPMVGDSYDGPIPFLSDYMRLAGGTTLHWQGSSFRMLPHDFRMNTLYGRGHDWPVTYDELMPFYREAEHEIGVSADVKDQSYLGVHFEEGYHYPMKRMPQSVVDQFFMKHLPTGGKDELRVELAGKPYAVNCIPLPQGRNAEPHPDYVAPDGTPGYDPVGAGGDRDMGLRCQGNSSCMPICPVQAKYNGVKSLHGAMRNGAELRVRAVASRLIIDPGSGRITGVEYKEYADPSKTSFKKRTVHGKVVVLAANAIENVTLLLASDACKDSRDQLGKNLMDHPYIYVYGSAPEAVYPFRGPDTTTGLDSLRDGDFRRHHAASRASLSNWGWSGSPKADVNEGLAMRKYGGDLRRWLRERLTTQVKLGIMLEQLPSAANQVGISPDHRDALGNFKPVIQYGIDEYSLHGLDASVKVAEAVFARCGVTNATHFFPNRIGYQYVTYNGQGFNIMGSGHIVGTHRMGKNRRDGVVDRNLRAFDHPNLYVVGCGSQVTIGTCNPTVTGLALGFKAVKHIEEVLK